MTAAHPERARAAVDVVREQEVAVADDRHRDGGRDLADGVPVGVLAVTRVAGAAVHDDGVRAAVDRGLGLIEVVARLLVPPEPDLGGDRDLVTARFMPSMMRRMRAGWRDRAAPRPLLVK